MQGPSAAEAVVARHASPQMGILTTLGARAQREGAHGVVRVELAVGGEVEVEQVEVQRVRERPVVERVQHERGGLHHDRLHLVRRADRPLLEEVRVVAHLAQLHQHLDGQRQSHARLWGSLLAAPQPPRASTVAPWLLQRV